MSFPLHSWPRAILHIDGDAFFASCEQALHPEYRGRAVITGAERGIVAAASYEAKKLGISRGTPLWEVKKICPDAIILPSDYETYSLFSKRMFAIVRRYTEVVEEYSIDECFADLTGLRRPHHTSYEGLAEKIKKAVESELGLTVSVGVSLSKVLAKVASKFRKPSGLTIIPGRKIPLYLDKTPLEKIWGIGPQTTAYCKKLGLITALDFASKNEWYIKQHFDKPQIEIWQELNGQSVYEINPAEKDEYASIGKTKTFVPPSSDFDFVFGQVLKNLENACIKARRYRLATPQFSFFLTTQNFESVGAEINLSRSSAYPAEMAGLVREAFAKIFDGKKQYRATGVVLNKLAGNINIQPTLFESPLKITALKNIYQAVDELATKYGKHCVYLAGSIPARQTRSEAERNKLPLRKLSRLKGETARQHLALPMLMRKVT